MDHKEVGSLAVRGISIEQETGSNRWKVKALLLLAVGVAGCARMETRPAAEAPPPAGFARGIVYADNTLTVSLEGAQVRVEDQIAVVGKGGVFSLPRVSPGKRHFVAEKRFPSGPVRRVLGVATIYVSENPIELKIRMRDATDVDAFCSDCHPMKWNVTRKDQIFRDVHPSGIVPKKAKRPGARLDAAGRVTCESCHTVHLTTASGRFTLDTFRDGKLCAQCH